MDPIDGIEDEDLKESDSDDSKDDDESLDDSDDTL